jgi:Asp-tRNA(Asn)/Glu-tRNA(Gln) amidotransferase A subunit family amidase
MRQFETDCGRLRSVGYEVIEIPAMDDFEAIVERHNLILAAEAAKVHQSWYGAFNEEYHTKTVELILRGEAISNEALQEGLRGQGALRSTLENLMNEHGIAAWITPSAPGPAPRGLESTGDPVMNLPWTHSGMPTVTLPSGKSSDGLPLGIQLIARSGQDEQLLIWAGQLEGCLEYESLHGLGELFDALR